MQKYISYLRVSTRRQGQSGLGLEAQRAAVHAQLDNLHQLLGEYVDVESGAKDKNRPQLQLALADCKARKATLIIAKLDRLARNVAFISALMESKVDFIACDMPTANKFQLHIMAAVAEQEHDAISARTKEALAQAKKNGRVLGSPHLQEYAAAARKKRWPNVLNPEVKALIDKNYARGVPFQVIARDLNKLGIKTQNGNDWYASSVRNVVRGGHVWGKRSSLAEHVEAQ